MALATRTQLVEGLCASSIRGWPNLRWDLAAALDLPLLRHLTAAGFYYKTFMWPRWEWFEPWIRHAAGPARVALELPEIHAHTESAAFDAIVIGAGAAGIAAAVALDAIGHSVALIEEQALIGGSLLGSDEMIEGVSGDSWLARQQTLLQGSERVTILRNTLAFGRYDNGTVAAVEEIVPSLGPQSDDGGARYRFWKLRAPQVILATGALETPLLFPGNDRPGVMLASAAHEYLRRFAVQVGHQPVIITNNDSAYAVAAAFTRVCSVPITVLDSRPGPSNASRVPLENAHVIHGAQVVSTSGLWSFGRDHRSHGRVRSVRFKVGAIHRDQRCDAVLVSGGWMPAIQLGTHTSVASVYERELGVFIAARKGQDFYAVGAAAGIWCRSTAVGHARAAAQSAHPGVSGSKTPRDALPRQWPVATPYPGPPRNREAEVWIDLQNDVTARDLRIATDHGLRSIEHIKRFTTVGMGTDQGRTSALNSTQFTATLLKADPAAIGCAKSRPPVAPVCLAAFAGVSRGQLYHPRRLLPASQAHEKSGAVFDDFGGWQRPDHYRNGSPDRECAVTQESKAVRHAVGLFDGSPLGKIEVVGPDAAAFLNRFYIADVLSLPVGRIRYSLMLTDQGTILDDGVITRKNETHFLLSPSSTQARRVLACLESWHQIEWPGDRVSLTDVTEQWAVLVLAGPRAREVLRRMPQELAMYADRLPHMAFVEGATEDFSFRIFRVSFTGAVQFEINVPARHADWLWTHFLKVGADAGICPVGVEAWMRLRVDKGYIHIGSETDGQTTPDDLGFGEIRSRKTCDYLGRRSLELPAMLEPNRLQLVGLLAEDPTAVIPEGAHLIEPRVLVHEESHDRCSGASAGHVTSSCLSIGAGRSVALAMLRAGRSRIGEWVTAYSLGRTWRAQIVRPVFYDPMGTCFRE